MLSSHPVQNVGLPYRTDATRPLDPADLEEFHQRHARDARWARAALVAVVIGLLGLNLWTTQQTYEALTVDIDASRLALSQVQEQNQRQLEQMEAKLATIESRLPATP